MLDCPVLQIDHSSKRLKIETAKGVISADQAIVTLPTSVLGDKEFLFDPALPEKTEAARGLPLGLDDKLFLSLENAEEFDTDTRIFGNTDGEKIAMYHMRPFGRPQIEVYFGGMNAWELEAGGDAAFLDFAQADLARLLGGAFKRRVKLIGLHRWGADPFSRGAYSYALPGKTGCRAQLAAVGGRSAVLCRRGLFEERFLHRAWRLSDRRRRGGAGDRRAQAPALGLKRGYCGAGCAFVWPCISRT